LGPTRRRERHDTPIDRHFIDPRQLQRSGSNECSQRRPGDPQAERPTDEGEDSLFEERA